VKREQDKECVMADHDRSPQHTPREDPGDPGERTLDPYLCLVAAFLRQVVTDARSTNKGTGHWTEHSDGWTASRQREAQEFLLDLNRLAQWVELTGADVERMQGVLLRAAGLARPLYTGEPNKGTQSFIGTESRAPPSRTSFLGRAERQRWERV